MAHSSASNASLAGSTASTSTKAPALMQPTTTTSGGLLAPPSNRMMRSPSRESVISNVSLISLSSYGSELALQRSTARSKRRVPSFVGGNGTEFSVPNNNAICSLGGTLRQLRLSSSKNALNTGGAPSSSSSTLLRCQSTTIPQIPRAGASSNAEQPINFNQSSSATNYKISSAVRNGLPSQYRVARSFSFSNIATQQHMDRQLNGNCGRAAHMAAGDVMDGNEIICAISNPSLSLASDFDDDDFGGEGEDIALKAQRDSFNNKTSTVDDSSYVEIEETDGAFKLIVNSPYVMPKQQSDSFDEPNAAAAAGDTPRIAESGKKLRHRIKRKFLKLSLNDLWWKRGSGAGSGGGSHGAKKVRPANKNLTTIPSEPQQPPQTLENNQPQKSTVVNALPPTVIDALERRRAAQVPASDTVQETTSAAGLTEREVEREQGRLMSRYERNLQIFDWLHDLEEQWYDANRSLITSDIVDDQNA